MTTASATPAEEPTGIRRARLLLVVLVAIQGLLIFWTPLAVVASFDDIRDLFFEGATSEADETVTMLIAALFGFMAAICFFAAYLLWRKRPAGVALATLTGAYLIYIALAPVIVLERNDFVAIDLPRGVLMVALGIVVGRRSGF